ncbi:class I SAM-dependent methyltransferase [Chitinilyticum litopenaei]|uniref:class I SAM-dependent methyltransferase n=1 Tax=Chitinilyticum litopenaei TaxID=1121276 RepID=UPI00041CFA23|nr:class I SAM-dependent methyltransferase [Chitinilyticum litopenaei]
MTVSAHHPGKTLLLPLLARAHAAQLCPELDFRDPLSERLAYRWRALWPGWAREVPTLRRCCLRSAWLDGQMLDFLARHPATLCINLGAGLDTAHARLAPAGRPAFDWVDVDLPDVTALKARVLQARDGRMLVSCDVRRAGWTRQLPTPAGRAVLIRAEGLLLQLRRQEVLSLLGELSNWSAAAPAVRLVFDWLSPFAQRLAAHREDGKDRGHWGLAELDELPLSDPRWRRQADFDLHAACGRHPWLGSLYKTLAGKPLAGCQTLDRRA